jgi:hypothetical protein
MKKLISLCLLLFTGFLVNAQQNLLPPIGNVGVNTLRPMYPLDVQGVASFSAPVLMDSVLKVNHVMNYGSLELSNLPVDSIGNSQFILGLNNGLVQALSIGALDQILGGTDVPSAVCYETKIRIIQGQSVPVQERTTPFWKADTQGLNGYLVTGVNCPTKVGIGYVRPERDFEVKGLSYMKGGLLLGDKEILNNPLEQEAYLDIRPSDLTRSGVRYYASTPTTNTKMFRAVADNFSDGIAYSAEDYSAGGGRQTFKVFGDGLIEVNRFDSDNDDRVLVGKSKDHQGVELFGNGKLHLIYKDTDAGYSNNIINVELENGTQVFRVKEDGRTYANEVFITLPVNFPDYVFEKDYHRMSLREVEEYVTKNKHLPGMPTAEQVNNEGLDIAKVQLKTLEKLEELYLHVMDLQHTVEELKLENKKLKEQIIK